MYIGPDSLALVQHWLYYYCEHAVTSLSTSDPSSSSSSSSSPTPTMVVDICTGSGIQALAALVMLGPTSQAVCVDLNPRALRFAAFNAALNGLQDRVQYILGNVLSGQGQLWTPDTTRGGSTSESISIETKDDKPLLQVLREAIATAESSTTTSTSISNTPTTPLEHKMNVLMLANPPFLPVPPDILQARHGLFSAGGPSGEAVLASIVQLASQLLPETTGHGYLAVVSEFFLQKENLNDNDNAEQQIHVSKSKDEPGTTAATALMDRMKTWWGPDSGGRGLLLTNQFPVSAATYAERRADSLEEESVWLQHLQDLDIAAASPGLLYIQKLAASKHPDESKTENENSSDGGSLLLHHVTVPKSKWGSIWTPSNPAGVEFTQSVCQQYFADNVPDAS
jgi:methylase of polypeptide subunit release factors